MTSHLLVVPLGPVLPEAAALAAAAGMPATLVADGRAGVGLGARAIRGFDAVLRGDATAAVAAVTLDPGMVAALVQPIARGDADVVLAVPKRAGWIDRRAARWLGTAPGALRWQAIAASRAALARLPYRRNADDALFACELAIQAALAGLRVATVPAHAAPAVAPASRRARLGAVLRARVQPLHILYDRRFDVGAEGPAYAPKLGYKTPHTIAAQLLRTGERVLDLGAADGYVARLLAAGGCVVTAVDREAPQDAGVPFIAHDLDRGPPPLDLSTFDAVLMLDVLEHLRDPERFVEALGAVRGRLIVSTGNVAFIVTRLMLLLGQFNYGRRGILDRTHTRLFTRASLERLLHQCGFRVTAHHAIPAPFPAALGAGALARALVAANDLLARVMPGLFAYQVLVVAERRTARVAAR